MSEYSFWNILLIMGSYLLSGSKDLWFETDLLLSLASKGIGCSGYGSESLLQIVRYCYSTTVSCFFFVSPATLLNKGCVIWFCVKPPSLRSWLSPT